ncbi:hypothetical protein ACWCRD_02790 [Streptomyces sp. NPDC002092]
MASKNKSSRWPFGVVARYQNLTGAMVDVRGPLVPEWKCNACQARSPYSPRLSADEAARQAQAHALSCSAVAR